MTQFPVTQPRKVVPVGTRITRIVMFSDNDEIVAWDTNLMLSDVRLRVVLEIDGVVVE